jgi:hypothetical protein
MGCHSGLSVPDGTLAGATDDFPQRLLRRGAAYVGVTGYGYGDLATAGLHERLLVLYGRQMGFDQDLGAAMRAAKQQYFAQQGLYGNADEKVLATTTLFGLPMYRLGEPGNAPAVPTPTLESPVADGEGVSRVTKTFSPTFTKRTTPTGSYYSADGEHPQVTPGRPVQPRVVSEVTATSGTGALLPAHGALITELSLRPDESGFDAAFTRPVTDLAANEPERPFSESTFPSSLASITTYDDPQGPAAQDGRGVRQNLVLLLGQYFGDGTPDAQGVGVQRTFDAATVDVQYSDSDDFAPPAVGAVEGILSSDGPQADFTVRADDPSGIRTVLVMWRTTGDYQPLTLTQSGGTWRGTADLPAGTESFEYFVQVVDGAGNVATASSKGNGLVDQPPVPPAPPADVSAEDVATLEGTGAGTTTVQVPVTLAAPSTQAVTVPWSLEAGTASAGSDFADESGSVTVAAGQLSATVPVAVQPDDAVEPAESFSLRLQDGSTYDLVRDRAVVTIVDDDTPVAPEVSVGDLTVSESEAEAQVPVTLSRTSSQPVEVAVTTVDGTATAGDDYTATTTTVTIAAGQTSADATVPLLGDSLDEPDETFTVRATSATGASILDGDGVVTLTDDDGEPAVSVADGMVTEGTGGPDTSAQLEVTLDAASGQEVTVPYTLTPGTATADDADLSGGTLVFPAGTTTRSLTVPVVADALDEPDETLTVDLGAPDGATLGDGAATLTISDDDDEPTVSVADRTVVEGTGAGVTSDAMTVTLSAPSGRAVTVPWQITTGSASADDLDLGSGTLVVPAGETSGSIPVQIVRDALDEPDETATVTLGGPTNATLGDSTATLTIVDDDGDPTVSVEDVSVTEGTGGPGTTAQVTVSLGGPSGRTVSVPWSTSPGTATPVDDFLDAEGTVQIPAGETSGTFPVTIAADGLDEADETVLVDLGTPTNATLADGSGVLTIVDDDAEPLISVEDGSVTEGTGGTTDGQLTVTLSATSGKAVTATWATVGGTATEGDDYEPASGTVQIEPGATEATVSLAVVADSLDETDETVTVTLSDPSEAVLGDATGTLSILDDDDPQQAPETTVDVHDVAMFEGPAGARRNMVFHVTLSRPAPRAMSVRVQALSGSAIAGTDFNALSRTLSFSGGQSAATVAVKVRGDTSDEPDEQLTLQLSSPTGQLELGDPVATGSVLDDDRRLRIALGNCRVVERDSDSRSCNVPVLLSRSLSRSIAIDWRTYDGTATTADRDYRARDLRRTLSRPVRLPVRINGDRAVESTEWLRVGLTGVNRDAVIAPSPGLAIIVNDDVP